MRYGALQLGFPQDVTDTAHGLDKALFAVIFDFEAEIANIDLDHVGFAHKFIAPDIFKDLLPC